MDFAKNFITIKGAREHNLKNIEVKIPKGKLVVFSGVSGSGKSSLAMDTLYAEGQRRYVESLSSYARQFLGMMRRPKIDTIEGLSPAIAIDQHGLSHNPRSTVGTSTEIYDYLRLLFARLGHPHCPHCQREITRQTSVSISKKIIAIIQKKAKINKVARYLILSPIIRDKRGEFSKLFDNLDHKGFEQVRLDGQIINLSENVLLKKTNRHNIEVVVDRINLNKHKRAENKEFEQRILDSIEIALDLSDGLLILAEVKDKGFSLPSKPKKLTDTLFSKHFACPNCNISLSEIEPRIFSFNSPHGACPKCEGIGVIMRISPDLVLNKKLSILEGGITPWFRRLENESWTRTLLEDLSFKHNFSLKTEIHKLPKKIIKILLYGEGKWKGYKDFEGVATNLERRYRNTDSDFIKKEIEKYMYKELCPICLGARLKKEALAVNIDKKSIADISSLSLNELYGWIKKVLTNLSSNMEKQVALPILNEVLSRLQFLLAVGVNYLSLDRTASTLSVGEVQRIRLASQIGTGLTGVLYVLDEPTVGLHQRDTHRLINTLKNLRDLGNTVVVVEHDNEVLQSADHIIDFGPLAGKKGGQIMASGTLNEIKKNKQSLTGKYLSGKKKVKIKNKAEKWQTDDYLIISGCSEHNLKNITAKFPMSTFTCLTGISGSGKSTLMHDTLYLALKEKMGASSRLKPGQFNQILGWEKIDQILLVDQSPIGRSSRSNPATYTGVWTEIRELFANLKESRLRGFTPGHFSFNVNAGRCEACRGQGVIKVEMQFLPDVWIECEECRGMRFKDEILQVEYKGKNISQVLDLSIEEAMEFFTSFSKISQKLQVLKKIGLEYLQLGQRSPTLSGGESQRLKLARELVKSSRDHTLYLLDEPTTGLHFADTEKLLMVIRELINKDNTVIIIEHNLDIIKNADHIIDLGPEGGNKGGEIISTGTPQEIAQNSNSWTGQYLKKHVKTKK